MQRPNAQAGAYLLEALIGILIFSFGILGIVGLQAQAIRFTNDAEYRAEATYLANSLISTMWTDYDASSAAAIAAFKAKYTSGAGYTDFKTKVVNGLSGATVSPDPVVLVDDPTLTAAPSTKSSVVSVKITWTLPGDSTVHNYTTSGVVGTN
jgi:type IV pilus assembly protein PilV